MNAIVLVLLCFVLNLLPLSIISASAFLFVVYSSLRVLINSQQIEEQRKNTQLKLKFTEKYEFRAIFTEVMCAFCVLRASKSNFFVGLRVYF